MSSRLGFTQTLTPLAAGVGPMQFPAAMRVRMVNFRKRLQTVVAPALWRRPGGNDG